MKVSRKSIAQCVETLLEDPSVRRATVYFDERTVVKATTQRRIDKRRKIDTVLLTIGGPNFVERRFIRACKKAGEPLPVRKVQLKFWPSDK